MSSHWKFEIHIKTPGETDDEEFAVARFAETVRKLGASWSELRAGADLLEIVVTTPERN